MAGSDIKYRTRDLRELRRLPHATGEQRQTPGILLITAIFGVDQEMRELADEWAAAASSSPFPTSRRSSAQACGLLWEPGVDLAHQVEDPTVVVLVDHF